ncbi:MAG TPA: hypothetical protein VG826_28790 [Pirellulales bacterium]|nr:hypothetical protein [Pirellulales bacterium]
MAIGILTLVSAVAHAQPAIPSLEPYALPPKAKEALCELASKSDVLILGEIHGTQEVPALALALLQALTEQGYGALALEIPSDQQKPLSDWAMGMTETIPSFFTEPVPDGRSNIQTLSLIRTALSPPFGWRLICFDESWEGPGEAPVAKEPAAEDPVAAWMQRDAKMAANLVAERSRLAPGIKVLAICGNFHARTLKPTPAENGSENQADDQVSKLWPSFAARLRSDLTDRRVSSVNVMPHSGGYFAMTATDDGKTSVGVQTIRGTPRFQEAQAHPLENQWWDWELDLPRATPATFLTPPKDPFATEP